MRKKLTMTLALAAVGCICLFSAPPDSSKIKEIRRSWKSNCDLSRSGIMAGYMACQRGIPLTNFLAEVERAWEKLLVDRITEESER